jgi:phospholipase/carboxylesterase
MSEREISLTRRRFIALGAALVVPPACGSAAAPGAADEQSSGRLTARPSPPAEPLAPGTHPLELGQGRDGFIYIPTGYQHNQPTPLAVLFHGAGRAANEWQAARSVADALGIVFVAPDSRGGTWDVVRSGFGPDVAFLDRALQQAYRHCSVDPERLAFAGFSDGASYALSLGAVNGDFVTHILAFSPGFMVPGERRGKPRVYVTHGTGDTILPIESTSRRIVPALRAEAYDVTYIEFGGGHQISAELGRQAFEWFVA